MDLTVQAAAKYPGVRFLNCSVGLPHQLVRSYYGKMYEAKFLLGALAASMTNTHRIGYRAYYPVLGTIAEINAFALGAALIDPRARVVLSWSRGETRDLAATMREQGVDVMSGSDVVKPFEGSNEYGLHMLRDDGALVDLAGPAWRWDRYYELIVRSLLHGTWDEVAGADAGKAVNYWYGLSSGVIDVDLAPGLPVSTHKLMGYLRSAITSGAISPFEGELHSQEGEVQPQGAPRMSSIQVVSMTWLASNVEGSLPAGWELSERAQAAAKVAGVLKA